MIQLGMHFIFGASSNELIDFGLIAKLRGWELYISPDDFAIVSVEGKLCLIQPTKPGTFRLWPFKTRTRQLETAQHLFEVS